VAYLSLYRKYRSETFDELLGQDHVSTTLKNAIVENRVAHAYLFTGPRGTGKTSTARILAKALNCERGPTPTPCGKCDSCVAIANGSSLDVIEMDAASHSKVDETRDVLAGVPLATSGGRKKVYVIDEVHMLSSGSFNALLKTLEEPPDHVLFILATTEAHKVLPTIVSRTQRFDFRRIPAAILQEHLKKVAAAEGIDVDDGALSEIARRADGSARDALSALDQVSSAGHHVSAADADALLGDRREDEFSELFEAIAAGDVGAIFSVMGSLVAKGADVRQLAFGSMEYARSLLLLKTAPDAGDLLDVTEEQRSLLSVQAESLSTADLLRALDLIGKAITEMRNAPHHRLLLEVALVRVAAPDTDPSVNGMLGRIERLERRLGIAAASAPGPEPVAAPSPEPRPSARDAEPPAEPAPEPGLPAGDAAPSAEPAPARATEPPAEPMPERGSVTAPGATPAPESAPPAHDAVVPVASSNGDAPVAESPGLPPQVGLAEVRGAWQATLQEVKRRSKRVWGMLNPSRPVRFEDGALVVEVQAAFHEENLSLERNRHLVGDSLHAALGIKPRLHFTTLARDDKATPAPAPDPVVELEDDRAVDAPGEDPVELMRKGLNAEVVDEIGER
jgi:DNA polymerase III subunit gamma/tau